ncbi:MAG: hypothetical protein ACKOQ4_08985 [Mycobacterium sp.]
MPDTYPSQPLPDSVDLSVDLAQLEDPLAAVTAADLTSRFVRLVMCSTEPLVTKLAGQEVMLRLPGGIDLSKRVFAQHLYRRIDADVFGMLRACVPLTHAADALWLIECLLREQFADVVGTAASYLLSDDRDTAIQMATVATTMAAREVRSGVADIIIRTRESDVAD